MNEILALITGMTPYLLLGFFLAGLMHAFVPQTLYRRYMGGPTFGSVFRAAMLGIPLPLCSCGVIPTAMSLHREGASKGATVSFLIATPQTGVDSIVATYSLMGLPFALLRPMVALVTSLLGGCLVNRFDVTACEAAPGGRSSDEAASLGGDSVSGLSFVQRLRGAFRYAFVEMMQDIGRWLVLGLLMAGLITVFVPSSFFAWFADQPLLSMLLVLAASVPMYLCATGSIPIAVALMLKGLSPGSALVLLMAGPAVNVASMMVIGKVMGRSTLRLYLLSIVSGAMGFGWLIDTLLPRAWFTVPLTHLQCAHDHSVSTWGLVSSVVFFLLGVNAFLQRYRRPHTACSCGSGGSETDACSAESAVSPAVSTAVSPAVWVTSVQGMSCNHCRNNVEKAILRVAGAERVDIDLASGQVRIYGAVDRDAVVKAVTALGFEMPRESLHGEVRRDGGSH